MLHFRLHTAHLLLFRRRPGAALQTQQMPGRAHRFRCRFETCGGREVGLYVWACGPVALGRVNPEGGDVQEIPL